MAIMAYLRVSTDTQDIGNQKLQVLEFAQREKLAIDDFIAVEISSQKDQKKRKLDELFSKVSAGDTLIVAELSRLGRSLVEMVGIVNRLTSERINLISIKENLRIKEKMDMTTKVTIYLFGILGEVERDIISIRTREALRAKRLDPNFRMGRPTGSLGKSKLDEHKADIERLLLHKVSQAAIARVCGTSRKNLGNYIRTRHIAGA